jgi:hypothetical protein
LGNLFTLLNLHDVDSFFADNAGYLAISSLHKDPLSYEDLGVPAAHARKAEKTVLVDVSDHKPDLVYVPG